MQGLEIARAFYEAHVRPMLTEQFPDSLSRIAVGVAGDGSECLGYDDALSRDHDFDPGCCLFITAEDERAFGFRLERAYAKLPRTFMGLQRSRLAPAGGPRRGVLVIDEFYTRYLGAPHAPDTYGRWLSTPSHALLAACSGEVYTDPLGVFSSVREQLLRGYPEDIRKKKLAAHLALAAQAGQYNLARCLSRADSGAAQLCTFTFVQHVISAVFLLNNRYEPFYKWTFRALRTLPCLGSLADALQGLLELDNTPAAARVKGEVVEDIATLLIEQLGEQGLSEATCGDLQKHAASVRDGIRDSYLRSLHLLEGA